MLAYAFPHWGLFVVGILATFAGAGANLAAPAAIRSSLTPGSILYVFQHPFAAAAVLLALSLIQAVAFYYRASSLGMLGLHTVIELRRQVYARLLHLPIAFFDAHHSGDLVSRLFTDGEQVQDMVSDKIPRLLRYALQIVVGLILMLYLAPLLTFFLLLWAPILAVVSVTISRNLRQTARLYRETLGLGAARATESLGGIRIIRAHNAERDEALRFSHTATTLQTIGTRRVQLSAALQSIVAVLMNIGSLLVLLAGVFAVSHGQLPPADLAAFVMYGFLVALSGTLALGAYTDLSQSIAATDRLEQFLAIPIQPQLAESPAPAFSSTALHVAFHTVTFSYPTRPTQPVLREISFTLEPGKTVALVGPSGSGKSTIVSLLLGFYEPRAGELRFNGQRSADINPALLREQIAYVPQDPTIFDISLEENVRLGRRTASLAEVIAACQRAHLGDFVAELADGLQTLVGERGTQLSGGQKQRLAIARAIIREPRLLILDEATAALDSETEAAIQQTLQEAAHNCTTLVIAHRLSTVRSADQVLVLDHGFIVQQGTHDELAASTGLYRELVRYQELS